MPLRVRALAGLAGVIALLGQPVPAWSWGDVGHEIVATLAASILKAESPQVLKRVEDLLEGDTDNLLTDHDIASQARWADAFRASSDAARELSAEWHFVDTDFDEPSVKQACFGHPKLKANELASEGPSPACIIDKIKQFTREIAKNNLDENERLLALKFLLHFVGDIHQPLHGITRRMPETDRSDRGGNCVALRFSGASKPTRLHSYWDTGLVRRALPNNMDKVVEQLTLLLTPENRAKWAAGGPDQWAKESYDLAKASVYAGIVDQTPIEEDFVFKDAFTGKPDNRCGPVNVYAVPDGYETRGMPIVKEQLAKAGFRLARLLQANLK